MRMMVKRTAYTSVPVYSQGDASAIAQLKEVNLQRTAEGLRAVLHGAQGEARAGQLVDVTIVHSLFNETRKTLRSDEHGVVVISDADQMPFIRSVMVQEIGAFTHHFTVHASERRFAEPRWYGAESVDPNKMNKTL